MNDSIYKSIKTLPPLDDTVVKIQQICKDDNAVIGDLIDVIKRDPMLTANILHSANSPLYGFSREISNVSQAVNLFGMATIRGFALYGSVKQAFKIDLSPYNLNATQFLDVVSTQNSLAFTWCKKVNMNFLNVLSPASFLMEVGKIIIAKELIESGKANDFKSKLSDVSNQKELSDLEISMVGVDSEEVAAKILEQWNFEHEIVDSILYLNKLNEAPKGVKQYCVMLNATKNAINVKSKLQEKDIANALNIIKANGFDEAKFKESLDNLK